MIKIQKARIKFKNKNFFNSIIGNITIFFIDKTFKIAKNIIIKINNKNLYLINTPKILSLKLINTLKFFKKNDNLLLTLLTFKNKKSIINLYTQLIKIKLKGILQGFKINLILKGIGFKALIENDSLILKLGFSHSINILIPPKIKIFHKANKLTFYSLDLGFLTQFIHFVKHYKKPEPYKGKGLLLQNEIILKKEGKTSKK